MGSLINNIDWNPIVATEKLDEEYFNFFLASFAPNNNALQQQLKSQLNYEYLHKGPYISISGQYEPGSDFAEYEPERIHIAVKKAFKYINRLYRHQEKGITHILDGKNIIVSVNTGSGKTEIFLIPIINYCYEHRSEPGVKAIIVYPMNALANDQVDRLRKILWRLNKDLPRDEQITFAIYTSDTPENNIDMAKKMASSKENCYIDDTSRVILGCSKDCDLQGISYDPDHERLSCEKNHNIWIDFQLLTRKRIRENPPDILITNYVQLEHLMLRKIDDRIFSSSRVKFLVFDEIHTYSGARGIDVALLIRRLHNKLTLDVHGHKIKDDPICIGLSATLSTIDEDIRKDQIASFGRTLFGAKFDSNDIIEGSFEPIYFGNNGSNLKQVIPIKEVYQINNLDDENISIDTIKNIFNELGACLPPTKPYSIAVGKALLENPIFESIFTYLKLPRNITEIATFLKTDTHLNDLVKNVKDEQLYEIIWTYLKLASLASNPHISDPDRKLNLINVNVHNFFKSVEQLYRCVKCGQIYIKPRDHCEICGYAVDELGVCRFCGHEFLITLVNERELLAYRDYSNDDYIRKRLGIGRNREIRLQKVKYNDEYSIKIMPIWQSLDFPDEMDDTTIMAKKCLSCGSILDTVDDNCSFCHSKELLDICIHLRKEFNNDTKPITCPFCGRYYGNYSALSKISISSNTASVALFDLVYSLLPDAYKKMLIFTDSRQGASYLAGQLEEEHSIHSLRNLIYLMTSQHENKRIRLFQLEEACINTMNEWFQGNWDISTFKPEEIKKKILLELSSLTGAQRSLENLGLIEINYVGLENNNDFEEKWVKSVAASKLPESKNLSLWRNILIAILDEMRTNGAIQGLHLSKYDKIVLYSNAEKISIPYIEIKSFVKSRNLKKIIKTSLPSIKNNSIDEILSIIFEFLSKQNFIVFINVNRFGYTVSGYMVSNSSLVVKIPTRISRCNKCKRVYANHTNGLCLASSCSGNLESIDFESFLHENRSNYYINLYTNHKPFKMNIDEDTGAISTDDRRKIENEFKKPQLEGRLVDTIIATPTLELGVDIGDLLSVGLFKAPPSPAHYLQRVGRAGRKERVSFNNTFLFATPIDKYYYTKPEKLIRGSIDAPILDLKNTYILQRHINSTILEDLLTNASISYPTKIREMSQQYVNKMISDIEMRRDYLKKRIEIAFNDIYQEVDPNTIDNMINIFINSIKNIIEVYRSEYKNYKNYYEELKRNRNWEAVKRMQNQIEKFSEMPFINYLMDKNILPRYAFPGSIVNIKEEHDYYDFGTRARGIAISEYTPNLEVYQKKKIYRSVGIDNKILAPTRKKIFVCSNCNKYATSVAEQSRGLCPICNQLMKPIAYDCIEPNVIYLKKTEKSISNARTYQEPISSIYIQNKPIEQKWLKEEPNIKLSNYGNLDLIQIVDRIVIENRIYDIELCQECGRILEKDREKHRRLGATDSHDICNGKFEKLALVHIMPTNVISIQLEPDTTTLFGVEITEFIGPRMPLLLTTLKNAIINAALSYTNAEDGEIGGEVKGNEIFLYDNVDGGAGYVTVIYNHLMEILKISKDIVLNCTCEHGCLDCLWSYRRKRDIPNIDKVAIDPVLRSLPELAIPVVVIPLKSTEIIKSSEYSFDGLILVRDAIYNAEKEIIIISDRMDDEKLNWPDMISKSWADILLGKKQSNMGDLKVNILLYNINKKIGLNSYMLIAMKLIPSDIDLYACDLDDTSDKTYPTYIIVDPDLPTRRKLFKISSSLNIDMFRGRTTIEISEDLNEISEKLANLKVMMKKCQKVTIKDLSSSSYREIIFVEPGQEKVNFDKIITTLQGAKNEIDIMDPYLKLDYLQYLFDKYQIGRNITLNLVITKPDKEFKIQFNELKRKVAKFKMVTYSAFNINRLGNKSLLHDRYIIIDNQTVISLGKGIDEIYEMEHNYLRSNVLLEFINDNNVVQVFRNNFKHYFENLFIKLPPNCKREVYE